MLSDSVNDYMLLAESFVLLAIGGIYAVQVLRKANKIEKENREQRRQTERRRHN